MKKQTEKSFKEFRAENRKSDVQQKLLPRKKIYQDQSNYDHTIQVITKTDPLSLTEPDMALTVSEIIKRFQSGRSVGVRVYAEYDKDDTVMEGLDLRTMDLSQIHDLMEVSITNIQRLETEKAQRRKEKYDKELEESIIKKYEARRKNQEPQQLNVEDAKFIQLDLPIKDQKE